MPRRYPLPRLWLMTDERMGDDLWRALDRLPPGSGVIFRHYGLALQERRALFARVVAVARRRRLVVLRAGSRRLGPGEQGTHGRRRAHGIHTRPAHTRVEAIAAIRAGADAIFVSPIFPTRSHPGARTLGMVRAALLIRGLPIQAIALGGMTARHARAVAALGFAGWAAIDAWSERTGITP